MSKQSQSARLLAPIDTVALPLVGIRSTALIGFGESVRFAIERCADLRKELECEGLEDLEDYITASEVGADKMDAEAKALIPDTGLRAAVFMYTCDCLFFRVMNAALREEDREKAKPFFPYLKLLLNAVALLPPDAMCVHRGIRARIDMTQYAAGKKFKWWSLSSTTASITVLQNEAFLGTEGDRVIFQINATNAYNIRAFSAIKKEDEYLLLCGTQLESRGVLNAGSGLFIVQLNEVGRPAVLTQLEPEKVVLQLNPTAVLPQSQQKPPAAPQQQAVAPPPAAPAPAVIPPTPAAAPPVVVVAQQQQPSQQYQPLSQQLQHALPTGPAAAQVVASMNAVAAALHIDPNHPGSPMNNSSFMSPQGTGSGGSFAASPTGSSAYLKQSLSSQQAQPPQQQHPQQPANVAAPPLQLPQGLSVTAALEQVQQASNNNRAVAWVDLGVALGGGTTVSVYGKSYNTRDCFFEAIRAESEHPAPWLGLVFCMNPGEMLAVPGGKGLTQQNCLDLAVKNATAGRGAALRDAFVKTVSLVRNGDKCEWFCRAVTGFATTEETKQTLSTRPMHDAFLYLTKFVDSPAVAKTWAYTFSVFTKSCPAAKKLFATPEARDAIAFVGSRQATTADAASHLSIAIWNVVCSDESVAKIYVSHGMRDALVAMASVPNNNARCAENVAGVIAKIGAVSGDTFSVPAVRDAVIGLAAHATDDGSCEWVLKAIAALALTPSGKQVMELRRVHDTMLLLGRVAKSPALVRTWASTMCTLTNNAPKVEALMGTTEMHDVAVFLASNATTPDASNQLSIAIWNIISTDATRAKTFATEAMRNAWLFMSNSATSPTCIENLCDTLGKLAEASPILYAIPAVRDVLVTMTSKVPSRCKAADGLSRAYCECVVEDNGKRVFDTREVYDALLGLADKLQTSSGIRLWAAAISRMTKSSAALGNRYFTSEVQNALIAVGQRADTDDSVNSVCVAMWNLIVRDAERAKGFATVQARDVLALMARYAVTNNTIENVASDITKLAAVDVELFAVASIRDALVLMMPKISKPNSAEWVSRALAGCITTAEGKVTFGTPAVMQGVAQMVKECTTVNAVQNWAVFVSRITKTPENQKLYCNAAIRDATLEAMNYAQGDDCINQVVIAVWNIAAVSTDNAKFFATESFRDHWITIAAKTETSVENVTGILSKLADVSVDTFATEQLRNALYDLGAKVKTAMDAEWFCRALCSCAATQPAKVLFANSPRVHDALTSVALHIKTPTGVRSWSLAISRLTNGDKNVKKVLGTEHMRNAVVTISSVATGDCVSQLGVAIWNLLVEEPEIRKLFATTAMRDAIVTMSGVVNSSNGAENVCSAISAVADGDPTLFAVPSILNVFLSLRDKIADADAVLYACAALNSVAACADGKRLLSTVTIRDLFLKMGPLVTTAKTVQYFCRAMHRITEGDNYSIGRFGTPEMKALLQGMTSQATSPESAHELTKLTNWLFG